MLPHPRIHLLVRLPINHSFRILILKIILKHLDRKTVRLSMTSENRSLSLNLLSALWRVSNRLSLIIVSQWLSCLLRKCHSSRAESYSQRQLETVISPLWRKLLRLSHRTLTLSILSVKRNLNGHRFISHQMEATLKSSSFWSENSTHMLTCRTIMDRQRFIWHVQRAINKLLRDYCLRRHRPTNETGLLETHLYTY